jgi:hypothetical protein
MIVLTVRSSVLHYHIPIVMFLGCRDQGFIPRCLQREMLVRRGFDTLPACSGVVHY